MRHFTALFSLVTIAASQLLLAAPASATPLGVASDTRSISYKLTYSGTPLRRQLFLDTDRSALSGFNTNGIGADYLVEDGTLYKFSGSTVNTWGWTRIGPISNYYDIETTGESINWAFSRKQLGILSQAAINVVAVVSYSDSKLNLLDSRKPQVLNTVDPQLDRDPRRWPFAQKSIWNMPIGRDAQFVHAQLPVVPSPNAEKVIWTPLPGVDLEPIVLTPDTDNVTVFDTKIYTSNVGWNKDLNRCVATGPELATVPMPASFIMPNSTGNNSATFLLEDRRTLLQSQPLARCSTGSYATSLLTFPVVDLYGPGITGAHGGSRLSAIGGSLRAGELADSDPVTGPRHTLKLNVDSPEAMHTCATAAECFTWPAATADSGAVNVYGKTRDASFPPAPVEMKMGALLAIPGSYTVESLGLVTTPAKKLFWTLQNYGTYLADSTGGPAYVFSVEEGASGSFGTEFARKWNFKFDQRLMNDTDWVHDIQKLISALHVVKNNGPTNIGGGGQPLQTLAPAFPAPQ